MTHCDTANQNSTATNSKLKPCAAKLTALATVRILANTRNRIRSTSVLGLLSLVSKIIQRMIGGRSSCVNLEMVVDGGGDSLTLIVVW